MRRRHLPPAALIVALALAGGAATASAATVRVDDDGKASATSCDGAAKAPKTIQAGVTAAGAGGTVLVCPGTYKGSIRLGGKQDGIVIKGTAARKVFLEEGANTATLRDLIVITSAADRVTVQGLTLRAAAGDCQTRYAINSVGRKVLIKGNRILGRDACFSAAVVIDQAATGTARSSATVSGNLIKDADTLGVAVGGARTTATVKDNTIRYVHTERAPLVATARRGRVTPTGLAYPAGVWVERDALATITGNTISGVADPAAGTSQVLTYGVRVRNGGGATVTGNAITTIITGVELSNVHDAVVSDNTVTDHEIGIRLYATVTSSISGNTVTNGSVGIDIENDFVNFVLVVSSGNTITGNVSTGHTDRDCYDNTSGDGTKDTANVWTNNTSDGNDFPDGLCPAPVP